MGDLLLDICMQKTRQRTRMDISMKGVAGITGYFHPQQCPECKRMVGVDPNQAEWRWYPHAGCTFTG